MCLHNSPYQVEKLLNKAKKLKQKWMICYKQVYIRNDRLEALHRNYVYKVGENVSDSRSTKVCSTEKEINRGIHVYAKIKPDYGFSTAIIPVKCYFEDLIGVSDISNYGNYSGLIDHFNQELVFRKIYISRKQYNKAVKSKNTLRVVRGDTRFDLTLPLSVV